MQPTNHTVTILNRYGNTIVRHGPEAITAPVVHVKDLGGGRAEVRVETNYHIGEMYDYPATYSTGSKTAEGKYRVNAKVFTAAQN